MYLCAGKEKVLKIPEIIGIFDIASIEKTQEYKNLYDRLKSNEKIVDLSEGKPKTFILCKNKQEEAYITSILSSTLIKKI